MLIVQKITKWARSSKLGQFGMLYFSDNTGMSLWDRFQINDG